MIDERQPSEGLDSSRLRQINRLATSARMVASLAHELNNSLQVVSGLVELLGDRGDIPADALARIQKIGSQAEKATTAIRQILAYARDGAQTPSPVNLSTMVEQALALRRYNLGRTGITATTELPSAAIVMGYDRSVLQILLNLLVNAEEALASQPQRHVRIAVVQQGSTVRLEVTDSGHGVPSELYGRIFEPFFTTRTGERALGLGLPVARELAKESGGSVTLVDPGPGTTKFAVTWNG